MSTPPVLAFDADDRLVALDGQGLRIWPAGSVSAQTPPAFRQPLPGGPRPFRNALMAKSADGQNMLFARSSSIFLWNVRSGDEILPIALPSGWGTDAGPAATKGARFAATGTEPMPPVFRAAHLAPNADRIYLLEQRWGQGSRLQAWAINRPSPSSPAQAVDLNWNLPLADGAIAIALRPDGGLLAVGERTGSVSLLDTSTRKVVARIPPPNQDSDSNLLAMTFSPDGQNMAIGSAEGIISLWSVAQPKKPWLLFHLPGHRGTVTSLAYDAQNRWLASAVADRALVEVWDLELLQRELIRLGLGE